MRLICADGAEAGYHVLYYTPALRFNYYIEPPNHTT